MRLLTPLYLAFVLLVASAVLSRLTAKARRWAGWLHFGLTAEAGVFLAYVGVRAVSGGGMDEAVRVLIGPFGVPFLIDGLSGLFLIVIGVMAAVSALFSVRYIAHDPEYGLGGYYFYFPLFILGMAALVAVDDLSAGFTLAWQIMTIASFLLIRFEHKKRENRRAAAKYLVLMEIAWACVVGAGIAAGGGWGDSLHILSVKVGALSPAALFAVYGLLLVGFGLKAGLFPLGQLWLPDAHSVAPSPVSALLSGVMLKTGIFGIIRVFFFMIPDRGSAFDPRLWGFILAAAGALTLFIGTLQSVKQSDAKRLLAFSSIGQIGYIVLGLGAALIAASSPDPGIQRLAVVAIVGSLMHVLNHAIFKGLLFLVSGSLIYATGTKDLNKLGGLVKFMPVSAVVTAIASLSISGMPPTSGYASKWTIISSSLLAGGASAVLVLAGIIALFTSAVTLACYVKFFGMAFTGSGAGTPAEGGVREVPASMLAPKIFLAAVCIAQGLFPFLFIGLISSALRHSAGFPLARAFAPGAVDSMFDVSLLGLRIRDLFGVSVNAAAAPLIVLGILLLAMAGAAWLRRSAGSKEVRVPTWLCGYRDLDARTRFVDRGMFAALKNFFRWTGGRTGPKT